MNVDTSTHAPNLKLVLKVWLPGHSPVTHEPALILYGEKAVQFFVQALIRGPLPFFDRQAFAMSAHAVLCGVEREIAHGTYRVCAADDGSVGCQIMYEYESGMLDESWSRPVISALLEDACREVHQVVS